MMSSNYLLTGVHEDRMMSSNYLLRGGGGMKTE